MSEKNKKTQIWCTLGPSSLNRKVIQRLEESGVTMFRINLSHTKEEEIEQKVLEIRQHTTVPVCLDTEGPQIRTGVIDGGETYLKEGEVVSIGKESESGVKVNLRPDCIFDDLTVGDLISVDFDSALLSVVSMEDGAKTARVICEGKIGSNKAVTIDRKIDLPILSDKDRAAVEVVKKLDLKEISLSFVNTKEDVLSVREMLGPDVRIISKIETNRALTNLDEIISVSEGVLIDRGDLSREEPINKIPLLQKEIIRKANAAGKLVFVATNFLESMVKTKKPLRSEVNDIMTTLLDGASGLVLAAETAIGQYPAECGNMVNRMIKYFDIAKEGYSLEKLLEHDSFLLVEPNGGKLIERFDPSITSESLSSLPKFMVDELAILDAEQIAIGAYSPLEGFLTKDELFSVLDHYKLPSGTVWPMPILLQTSKKEDVLTKGQEIALAYKEDGQIYATMQIDDFYQIDLDEVAQKWFGTVDKNHPGVERLHQKGEYCIGGKITLIRRKDSAFKEFEYTPKQMRMVFEHKEWSKVAGFHTRNAIHRAHEYLQATTMDKYNLDGMLLHPVVGPKKPMDFQPQIILDSYKIMMEKHYPKNKFIFGAFSGYSHYAGPREAIFTALCRKNFGCSHFIMGRDHTGVKNYYNAQQAQELFDKVGDIGIKPIFFETVYYCEECKGYVERCACDENHFLHISGTQAREMLLSGGCPPDWFLREEISQMILDKIKRGEDVFVK